MNKRLFLSELGARLEDIPYREAIRVLNYYEEAIDDRIEDGMSEEDAVRAMGSVDDIARDILGEQGGGAEKAAPAGPYGFEEVKAKVKEAARSVAEYACEKAAEAKTMAEAAMEEERKNDSDGWIKVEYDTGKAAEESTALAIREYEENAVRAIVLNELSGDVEIAHSPDDLIHVECEDWRGLKSELGADGTLRIERERVRKRGKFLGISFDFDYTLSADVRLLLPGGFAHPLTVRTLSGDIECAAACCGELTVNTTSGDVDIEAAAVDGKSVIATTNGDVEINRLVTESLDIATTNGDIEMSGCMTDGKVSAIATNGDIDLVIGSVVRDGHFETVSGDLAVTLGGSEDDYAIRIKDGNSPEVVYGNPAGKPLVLRSIRGEIELNFRK